jgi:hypothetical protein
VNHPKAKICSINAFGYAFGNAFGNANLENAFKYVFENAFGNAPKIEKYRAI